MDEFKNMVDGKLYNAGDATLSKIHNRGLRGCQKINNCPLILKRRRTKLISKYIPDSKGKDFNVFTPFYFEYGINIKVGKECFVNYNSTFLDCAKITLGDNVWIGANVVLATPMHPFLSCERICNNYPDGYHDLEYAKEIRIGDNTWIGSSVTISGGVTIGSNSIIGAGSIVTSDIPDNVIAYGVPCKVIRKLDEKDRMNVWETYANSSFPLSVRDIEKFLKRV